MKIRTILATLLLAALPFSVLDAQEIRSVNTEVVLNVDGSADITQIWDATVVSGTEWYIPVSNLGKMKLSDLHVFENGQEYANEGRRWDVDRSLERKAGKCGIVEKDGNDVEICWGQGSYGDHIWTCKYHLSGLVQALSDYDAFNHQFVNPGLVATPKSARLVVINNTGSQEWNSENTRVWGFGFDGDIDVLAGSVVAELDGRLQSMNVMVRFDKGMFEPEISRDMTFEQMQEKAFKKSSYEEKEDWWALIIMLLMILPSVGSAIFLIVATATGHKYKKNLFGVTKIVDWFREAPLDGNIPAAWYVLTKGARFSPTARPEHLVGTYFLKWILEGSLRVSADTSGRFGSDTVLVFTEKHPDYGSHEEKNLYRWAVEAAGDKVLESSEFKKWSKKNSAKLVEWPKEVQDSGYAYLVDNNYISATEKGRPEHFQDLRNVIGFKNFLNDFTLSSEREARDVNLWKSYLIYAQMYGIAEKVAKQFKNLYPEFFQEIAQQSGMDAGTLMRTIHWNQNMSNAGFASAVSKQQAAAARSGYGGHTSFGGGGGFSGGGFGGGSR
ncbi:MAG: DUF2207 domain-containing protein [Bacteroidales bacterium]|nr:DUF2207 domain-containing protein [Bacteroidales bacterium]